MAVGVGQLYTTDGEDVWRIEQVAVTLRNIETGDTTTLEAVADVRLPQPFQRLRRTYRSPP